jgi:hypothetical protein
MDAGRRSVQGRLDRRLESVPPSSVRLPPSSRPCTGTRLILIDRLICCLGVRGPNISAFFERRLSPGDVIVDVGANTGYRTLLASKRLPEERLREDGTRNLHAINVAA